MRAFAFPSCLCVILMLAAGVCRPATVAADDISEASALFAEGNTLLQRGIASRGTRRTQLIEQALERYYGSLARVRSRNVLYNTAVALEALGRDLEAFNTWSEYLRVEGLTTEETADGRTHADALRPRVAVVRIESTPRATLWVDRRDLGPRGETPLELAVPGGVHRVILEREGFEPREAELSAATGETTTLALELEPSPVAVQVLAPPGTSLRIDEVSCEAGRALLLAPGTHTAIVHQGETVWTERGFEVLAGAAPMVIDLSTATAPIARGELTVVASEDAPIEVDGIVVGRREASILLEQGTHRLRVSGPGLVPYDHAQSFARLPARLEVHLAAEPRLWVHAVRGTGALVTLGSLGFLIGFVTLADGRLRENSMRQTQESADALREATSWVDVFGVASAVFGTLTLVSLALDAGGGESTGTLTVEPAPGGASLALRGTFAGAL